MNVDLSFFDLLKIFTYEKMPENILPCSIDVVKEFYPHKPSFDKFAHYKIPEQKLDKNFLHILSISGMKVKHAEIFYRPGNGKLMDAFIHTDGHRIVPGFAKINYIIGGQNNIMRWWRPKDVQEKNNMLTPIGTKYLKFDESECTLLDEVDMQGLYVVNAGIPHSVSMTNGSIDNPRICISVTPLLKDTEKNVACQDASTRLSSAILRTSRLDTVNN